MTYKYSGYATIYMNCPFCKNDVKEEYESISGCASCADDWRKNGIVDHPVD